MPAPERTFTQGIDVVARRHRRNHPRALNPMIKSNNLLNNALAMQEAYRRGGRRGADAEPGRRARRVLAVEHLPRVAAARSLTPPLSAGLLPGITRESCWSWRRRLDSRAASRRSDVDDLESADEAFITGTTRRVTPVVTSMDGRSRRRNAGAITRRLLEACSGIDSIASRRVQAVQASRESTTTMPLSTNPNHQMCGRIR